MTPKQFARKYACWSCGTGEQGPMLCTDIWARVSQDKKALLCQPCMEERLGRPLVAGDLRDCPMNYSHPLYTPHGGH